MTGAARETIIVVSVKRSGHHAFIDWFSDAYADPIAFFNNVHPADPPRLRTRAELLNAHPPLDAPTPAAQFEAAPHCSLLNIEGRLWENVARMATGLEARRGAPRVIRFLRDPLNCFASLSRRIRAVDDFAMFRLTTQVLGFESVLDAGPAEDLVVFSGWRFDDEVRAQVARRLGVANAPPPTEVSGYGHGSSFSGATFDPDAEREALLGRWRSMLDHPGFLALFRDPDFEAACRRYFHAAGARELVPESALDEIVQVSARSSEAEQIAKRIVRPVRREIAWLARQQTARSALGREFCSAMIQLRTRSLFIRRGTRKLVKRIAG